MQDLLTPSIAPMIYVMMFVSVIIGLFFLTGVGIGIGESILYSTGVLLHTKVWGGILFCTAISAELGFIFKKRFLVLIGGMGGFIAWSFACLALILAGHWYVLLTVSLLHLLFHGYVYLATSLEVLERQTYVE